MSRSQPTLKSGSCYAGEGVSLYFMTVTSAGEAGIVSWKAASVAPLFPLDKNMGRN